MRPQLLFPSLKPRSLSALKYQESRPKNKCTPSAGWSHSSDIDLSKVLGVHLLWQLIKSREAQLPRDRYSKKVTKQSWLYLEALCQASHQPHLAAVASSVGTWRTLRKSSLRDPARSQLQHCKSPGEPYRRARLRIWRFCKTCLSTS